METRVLKVCLVTLHKRRRSSAGVQLFFSFHGLKKMSPRAWTVLPTRLWTVSKSEQATRRRSLFILRRTLSKHVLLYVPCISPHASDDEPNQEKTKIKNKSPDALTRTVWRVWSAECLCSYENRSGPERQWSTNVGPLFQNKIKKRIKRDISLQDEL